ncbi:MAG: peptide chain release factor N(5)-glutamine methyltransferase [Clostridia bacterium]|nr:peptide chain release factor N(5)-glutamine methyltransferase [Clostridia bacterium]
MVIRQLLRDAPCNRLDAEVLLAHVLGISREKLLFYFNDTISATQAEAFSSLAQKRAAGCPVAQLIGEREFYSLSFFVTKDTLTPRPDTETLVEWAISRAEGCRVLDLCCGTGCIGISVAKNAAVSALTLADISTPALAVAAKNAKRHHVVANLAALDILKEPITGTFDMILSNPPYIETAVIPTLAPDVRLYEPHIALDGGADGLLFYPAIIEKAYVALSPRGLLGLEIGYTQAEAVEALMMPFFGEISVLFDLSGNPRAVVGRKSE